MERLAPKEVEKPTNPFAQFDEMTEGPAGQHETVAEQVASTQAGAIKIVPK
jgi:hypothetical protein